MKKIVLLGLVVTIAVGLSACKSEGNNANDMNNSTEQVSNKDNEKMEQDLDEKGVEIDISTTRTDLTLTREKSTDYEYFELYIDFDGNTDKIFGITLDLKGSISGESKDRLYYQVSKGRIVEDSTLNSDIDELAEVLDSLGYSDKEMLEFSRWYYDTNE
ncbi:hypothetical protein [Candidatus Enterococcus clewellii]|uniref:Lipoprotein n=1 Tax=Candidatus Enterococcus clewellii TaxID=1834193 RepID=A0AAQ3VSP2_9ENTE